MPTIDAFSAHRQLTASAFGWFGAGQQGVSAAAEEIAARELPPWMRAEASVSVSRSTDSTGAAQQLTAAQQQASSTDQQDLQVRSHSGG